MLTVSEDFFVQTQHIRTTTNSAAAAADAEREGTGAGLIHGAGLTAPTTLPAGAEGVAGAGEAASDWSGMSSSSAPDPTFHESSVRSS
jgi:hypothetical protein